jgi:hypothetical protein
VATRTRKPRPATEAQFENRGTDAHPFGFVYFGSGVRAGYTGGEEGGNLWNANWGLVSGPEFIAAWDVLRENGVLGFESPHVVRLRNGRDDILDVPRDHLATSAFPYED